MVYNIGVMEEDQSVAENLALKLLGLIMVASWGTGLALVLLRSPEHLVNRVFFFIVLYGAMFSTAALGAYWVSFRLFFLRGYQGDFGYALWQGFLFSGAVTGLAFFMSIGALTPAGLVLALSAWGALELLSLPERRR